MSLRSRLAQFRSQCRWNRNLRILVRQYPGAKLALTTAAGEKIPLDSTPWAKVEITFEPMPWASGMMRRRREDRDAWPQTQQLTRWHCPCGLTHSYDIGQCSCGYSPMDDLDADPESAEAPEPPTLAAREAAHYAAENQQLREQLRSANSLLARICTCTEDDWEAERDPACPVHGNLRFGDDPTGFGGWIDGEPTRAWVECCDADERRGSTPVRDLAGRIFITREEEEVE